MSTTEGTKTIFMRETLIITTTTSNVSNGNSIINKRSHSSLEQEADEEEEEYQPVAPKIQKRETCYAAYRRIQHTTSNKVTVERGQIHDFKHELHYALTTLFDEKANNKLKSLSLLQIVKKSVAPEFRDFLRTSGYLNKLFAVLIDLVGTQMISLSAACLLYFMARDRKGIPISEQCIRLISGLLRQENQQPTKSDEDYKKHVAQIWSIMQDWHRYWVNKSTKPIQLDLTAECITIPHLTLESLAYIASKEQSKLFKTELLNSGCLTSIVAKLDKVVLELIHSPVPKETGSRLGVVGRCYRILENAAAFDPKNQTFLVQHRNSLLIFTSAKFLNFSMKFIEESTLNNKLVQHQQECNKIFDNICLLCRVLMNVSHDNENASLKIGQVAGFLGNCLHILAQHSKHAQKEKFFDISVMMYGLLVNLLERCAANRRKFVSLKSDFLDTDNGVSKDLPALEILTKLFIRHDSAAKTIDEEFDNDLVAEVPEEQNNNGGNGRELVQNMSQDEILAAMQSLVSKASTHMEDSMIAAYCSLAIGILVGTDSNLAAQVKALMPNKDLNPMLEQLERFLDFMRITKLKANTVSNIERVLNSFKASTSTI